MNQYNARYTISMFRSVFVVLGDAYSTKSIKRSALWFVMYIKRSIDAQIPKSNQECNLNVGQVFEYIFFSVLISRV